MAQSQFPNTPDLKGLDALTHNYVPVFKLFFLYAIPLSLIPPIMLKYIGGKYAAQFLPALNDKQLLNAGITLFIAELIMTFLVAFIIQRMSRIVRIRAPFSDAYKLAVIVPTPFWLVPLFLLIPSIIVNATVIVLALIISGFLIFYNAPAILRVEDEGHAILLSGTILAIGMVAWVLMMYLALITWSWVASSVPH